jgi:hypothetical protein
MSVLLGMKGAVEVPQNRTYLLTDTPRLSSKHCIPAQQACKETIISALFPGPAGNIAEKNHGCFVDYCEGGEVARVLAGGFEYEFCLFTYSGSDQ